MIKPTVNPRGNRGFALIATILLMVLLAMITVGTLSLSVVTLRTGTQDSAQGVARANARMALMIAIGELQKQAGPDQRITASSSIVSSGSIPNPNWTGVLDSWIAGNLASTKVNSLYPSAGGSAHQTIGNQAVPLMRPAYAQKNRHFRGWLLSLYPEDVTNVLAPMSVSLVGQKLPQESDDAILLVSAGSAGSASAANNVSARLINLKPESDPTAIRGRYAWWVGDESQKATIMDDSYRAASELTMAQRLFRQEAPGSMGNTSVTGLKDMTDETQLANVASTKSVELLEGVGAEKARPRFHDITTTSYGVLADVREGGLKRDLNTILERNIDPNEVYDFTTVGEYQRPTSLKAAGQNFMLYNFDSMLASRSPTGMANVPIQDISAYYQLYDGKRPSWNSGIQYSSNDSSPANSYLTDGIMVSSPDFGSTATDFDKFLRQYTSLYRSPALVKIEMVLHYVAEVRTAAEIAAGLLLVPPIPATDTHKLRIGITPAMTFWNPNNVPMVMHISRNPDISSLFMRETAIPLNLSFFKSASSGGPRVQQGAAIPMTYVTNTQQGELYTFYVSGTSPLIFQPGESKVVSLKFASGAGGGGSSVDFMNRGARLNENFRPELQLIPGWNPQKFVKTSTATIGRSRGGRLDILTFKSGDYISVDVTGGNGGFGYTGISTARQRRNSTPAMYHHRLQQLQPRLLASPTYNSNFAYMGFPRAVSGGIVSTTPRTIAVPPRQADQIIAAMGIPANPNDDLPQTFFYYSWKAATETHESTQASPPSGGSGRRFPARPFLHSTPLQPPFFDNLIGSSLYNNGWNWFFMPLNNMLDAPISISAGNSGYFGGGYTAESGTTHVVQQQLPLTPPISIAGLSHARLGGYSIATEAPTEGFLGVRNPENYEGYTRCTANGFAGLAPAGSQAIGNSYAHPNIPSGKAFTTVDRIYVEGRAPTRTPFADHSYLANKALWDEFFFTSITPQRKDAKVFQTTTDRTAKQVADDFFGITDPTKSIPLPNRRMQPYKANMNQAELDNLFTESNIFLDGMADKIAAHLLVKGSFNVNSTSIEAWKAVLSGLKGKPVAYLDKDTSLTGGVTLKEATTTGVPVSAGGTVNAKTYIGSSTDPSDPEQWVGSRELTDAEITELATAMVEQVKLRGPFLSLSEFVNRRLDSSNPTLSVKGALQAALDDTSVSINAGFRSGDRVFTAAEKTYVNAIFPEAMDGAIAYGSAAYVDQADLLRNMAEQLTPRGDTFVIRTYGDSIDKSGKIVARAWCEAVVQRTPEYVDSSDYNYLKQADLTSDRNKTFGRKLEIIRFRWLNDSEI